MQYKEINGDLIKLSKEGIFDVITHGCNSFSVMGAGIAPQMDNAFGCNNSKIYKMESKESAGDINKLGQIEWNVLPNINGNELVVINSYTQYGFGKNHKKVRFHQLITKR